MAQYKQLENNQKEVLQQSTRRIQIREGEHFFVLGRTGMGKTFLTKKIIARKKELEPYLNVYHVDTKKRGDFSNRDGRVIASTVCPDAFTEPGQAMVWQPLVDDINEYSDFFTKILQAGLPSIVNIDEAINMKFGNSIPRGLSILSAQGRLPGISVIGGTQELAKAPRQMLSQASHIIVFNVFNEYDEKTALRYLRLYEQKNLNLKKHEFYYIRPELDSIAQFMKSYEELLPML